MPVTSGGRNVIRREFITTGDSRPHTEGTQIVYFMVEKHGEP